MAGRFAKEFTKKFRENWKQYVLAVISIAVFISAWQLYATYLHKNNIGYKEWIPYPLEVAKALWTSFTLKDPTTDLTMFDHIWASLQRVFYGFVIALAVSLPLGLLMGTYRRGRALGMPIVEMIRPIPPLAWIPIFIVVLGSFGGPVAIVFLGIFFPILLNVMLGVRSVDSNLIDAAKTLGTHRTQLFTKVVLPFTVPYLMTGIRVGLGIGWMCIVAAEMVGAYGGGVGFYIYDMGWNRSLFDFMYAGMIVIGVLGATTAGIASVLERRLSRWMGTR